MDREYFLSGHAEEEREEDDLDREDIEHVILHGRIERKLTQDPRGSRYRIEGPATDGRRVHVVCRFKEDAQLIIITVYAIMQP